MMRRSSAVGLLALMLLASLLAACEASHTQTGGRVASRQDLNGGSVRARIKKANGSAEQSIEVEGLPANMAIETDVTLTVETGSFKIELIGRNDQVTLALEASDGQTVSGHGWMAVDSFGELTYRITAVEAENVEYTIEYRFD